MRKTPLILAIAVLLIGAQRATAIFTFDAVETGGNVVFTGSGTLDLGAWSYYGLSATYSGVGPVSRSISSVTGNIDVYGDPDNFSGPASFGSGGDTLASSTSGSSVAFVKSGSTTLLGVTTGYTSGNALNSSMTFNSTNFATLGLTEGTYVWSWGGGTTGKTADSLVLKVGVPDTGTTVALLGLALTGLAFVRRRFA